MTDAQQSHGIVQSFHAPVPGNNTITKSINTTVYSNVLQWTQYSSAKVQFLGGHITETKSSSNSSI